ncbi:MAG: DUF4159 domain-containing protein [Phycisphaeraceae bacterium]
MKVFAMKMTKPIHPVHTAAICLALLSVLGLAVASSQAQDNAPRTDNAQPADSEIVVGRLVYDNGKTAVCFADQFLATYARETKQNVRRKYAEVKLDSDDLFELPFVVLSGQEGFELSDQEKKNLKTYIDRGGFVLASAGCSNAAWARSFEGVMAELYGNKALTKLDTDHALFHTVYDIDHVDVRRPGTRHPVQGLVIDGRVRVVYSPLGLNDTGNAGGECCCCGGSEIKNARLINVNVLAYALTH